MPITRWGGSATCGHYTINRGFRIALHSRHPLLPAFEGR
jgi:hypothetical protein